ncbi:MAG: methylated-DNA--[protein]-cysteine S-methyltransferase [Candidatus Kapaibacterium sp.]|nr:methylated-DNA--[protein]-cysteine S-methyltransferase [Bacteroidota bacterium]
MKLYTTIIHTVLGEVFVAASNESLYVLEFDNPARRAAHIQHITKELNCSVEETTNPILQQTEAELHEYLNRTRTHFTIPITMIGTNFQKTVWSALQNIPYGTTISYEELSHQIGNPLAIRAVGTANGQNKIAIIIPCHRVVNKSGGLGGFGGGLHRKEFLLKLENASFGSTTNQETLF